MLKLKRKTKLALYIVFTIFLIGLLIFEIDYSQNTLKKKSITYSKESSINYVTYLKENNHFSDEFLKDNYSYVANLIDYFNIDYSYIYALSEKIDYVLTYEVKAVLEVYDSDNKAKPIDNKNYQLVPKETTSSNGQLVKVELFNQKIDYETYSKIIEEWKKELSPDATLKVEFLVNWTGHSNVLNKEIGDQYTNSFEIPISNKIISINKPKGVSEKNKQLYANQTFGKNFYLLIGSTSVLILITMLGIINTLIKINSGKSKYEQKIKKILREFDRAITEAKGIFIRKDGEHYIEVKEFMELMDVHDNLNEPIIYYKNSNNASIFVVRNGTDIYYTIIRRSDFD